MTRCRYWQEEKSKIVLTWKNKNFDYDFRCRQLCWWINIKLEIPRFLFSSCFFQFQAKRYCSFIHYSLIVLLIRRNQLFYLIGRIKISSQVFDFTICIDGSIFRWKYRDSSVQRVLFSLKKKYVKPPRCLRSTDKRDTMWGLTVCDKNNNARKFLFEQVNRTASTRWFFIPSNISHRRRGKKNKVTKKRRRKKKVKKEEGIKIRRGNSLNSRPRAKC